MKNKIKKKKNKMAPVPHSTNVSDWSIQSHMTPQKIPHCTLLLHWSIQISDHVTIELANERHLLSVVRGPFCFELTNQKHLLSVVWGPLNVIDQCEDPKLGLKPKKREKI